MTKTNQGKINTFVAFIPHHINCLQYFDKLYDYLLKKNIEMLYIFKKNVNMEKYCKNNFRRYEVLDSEIPLKIRFLLKPYDRLIWKRKTKFYIKKYKLKLIVQYNDALPYNDIIVKVAQKYNVKTLVKQWATTAPEQIYFKNARLNYLNSLRNKSNFFIYGYLPIIRFLKIIFRPLFLFFGVNSNNKLSFGQGNSDIIGVINQYTKNLLIKQGVNKKKIQVLGSLHFDDALKYLQKKQNFNVKDKLGLKSDEVIIVLFSQPFYRKDITLISLESQLDYIQELIEHIDSFFKKVGKRYRLIIKLHPVEDLKDYDRFKVNRKIQVLKEANNYELIMLSDLCIGQYSTVLQSAIVMKKTILSLDILNLANIKIGSKVIGIKNTITSWDAFNRELAKLEQRNYSYFENINYDRVLLDGKSYNRILSTIKKLMNLTNLNQRKKKISKS